MTATATQADPRTMTQTITMERASREIRPELYGRKLVIELAYEPIAGTYGEELRWIVTRAGYTSEGHMLGSSICGRFEGIDEARDCFNAAHARAEGYHWRDV